MMTDISVICDSTLCIHCPQSLDSICPGHVEMGIVRASLLATLAKLRSDDIFGAFFGISPVAFAVWGWVSWARAKPRFELPKWWSGLVLAGLVSVSLALLTYVPYLPAMWAMSMDEFKDKMSPTIIVRVFWVRIDFFLNLFAIVSALIGKGRIRVRVAVMMSALLLQAMLFATIIGML